MPISKIVSAVPAMQNGTQKTWVSDKGTFYKYTVNWENLDSGEAMGKSPNPAYAIGVDYAYEKTEKNGFVSFKGIKKVEGAGAPHEQGKGNGDSFVSFWDKPRTIHYKMKPTCYKLALLYFARLPLEATSAYTRDDLMKRTSDLTNMLFLFVLELTDTNMRWARIALIEVALTEGMNFSILQSNSKFEGIKQFVLDAELCINANAPA